MNKTKIDLNNNLILRSENIEYNDDTLKSTLDNRFNYSTEEQKVGKWIDGKNLYRKTISFTDTIETNVECIKEHNISNVDIIFVDISNSFMISNNYNSYPIIQTGYNQQFEDKVNVHVNRTTFTIFSKGGWGTHWTKVVTLLYTKTAD